jgi:hypothetical protein
LVRCEAYFEESLEIINGTESYIQRSNDGNDEEVVYFPGDADPRASEDNKCNETQLGGRQCLSKEVVVLYITTVPWCIRMEYNKNIYTFLKDYNRLGRVSCEY